MASLNARTELYNSFLSGRPWYSEGSNRNDQIIILVAAVSLIITVIMWYTWMMKNLMRRMKYPLPPGPWGLPLVGNLPFVDFELHCYSAKMAKTYGPIFKLKLGSKLFVVVSSASLAKEVLKDYDTTFANRDTPSAMVTITYGGSGMIWTPYGLPWRTLRMICVQQILNKTSLDAVSMLRRREFRRMVKLVYEKVGSPINVAERMFFTSLSSIMSMLWGGALKDDEISSTLIEFKQATVEAIALMGATNLSDFFPILAKLDIQGIERRAQKVFLWFDRILESIVKERIKLNQSDGRQGNKDFLDILLELKDNKDSKTPITTTNIKALLQDLVLVATDTTATTVEWAMAEIMNHPEILKKIREELASVVGNEDIVQESHVPKLTYLDAVIKETFRLHSIVPFLVPRRPSESCVIGGYTVPKDSKILVNAWALQRDPEVWENPLEFQPDRFLGGTTKWDYSGNNYNFLPFGSGRRMCAGVSLVERTLPYALASLLHSFEWKLPIGVHLDLSATMTITLRKKTPLIAIPTARLSDPKLYL
ncbi:hypothetical protein AQUCO_04400086v1 [Aquilegia coerulea]|uniref:Cytochrome P450 n=1 Tax=Aquilegia coerulea TaxID=218851 RepID=A0A2G5CMX5_AQUCA|nr:hypothetical protein AQUCO_04400086v1 [Aquilegia coerulea]